MVVLQVLLSCILGYFEFCSYVEFLWQCVEINYFIGVFFILEVYVVFVLKDVKQCRVILIEDFCDVYLVLYEMVVYWFMNFVICYFDIFVYFFKVYEFGIIMKVYENDDVNFLIDRFGVIEGQMCCCCWILWVVFDEDDWFNLYYQYIDIGNGMYWCIVCVEVLSEGLYFVSVGVCFDDMRWFVGCDILYCGVLKYLIEVCCCWVLVDLEECWCENFWFNVKILCMLFVILFIGVFFGVDIIDVYEFFDVYVFC